MRVRVGPSLSAEGEASGSRTAVRRGRSASAAAATTPSATDAGADSDDDVVMLDAESTAQPAAAAAAPLRIPGVSLCVRRLRLRRMEEVVRGLFEDTVEDEGWYELMEQGPVMLRGPTGDALDFSPFALEARYPLPVCAVDHNFM